MDLLSNQTEVIGDELLEGWTPVGSGGFGHVYRARHKDWGFDVAIKLLRDDIWYIHRHLNVIINI